jgi:hypothetical protein
MKTVITALGLVVACALPAHAQQLNLKISDGRVTLEANNVPAKMILAEWARVGGTNVVGADKITGAPLTLKLVDMPERQALDIILRNVAGFIAAPRRTANSGASSYDRILVMATSANATQASANTRPGAPGAANANQLNGTQRRVPPPRPGNLPPSPADDTDDNAQTDTADTGVAQQPVFTFPAPQGAAPAPGVNQPVFVPMQNGQFGATAPGGSPTITLQPGPNGPTIYNFVPNAPNTPPPTATPFGVIGSPTPGMIQMPAPVPGQPGQPVPAPGTTKPPGR